MRGSSGTMLHSAQRLSEKKIACTTGGTGMSLQGWGCVPVVASHAAFRKSRDFRPPS